MVWSVLVTEATDTEWEQAMQAAAAVVIIRDDRSGHAARFCSERGFPCRVGAGPAAALLVDGMNVTVDCRNEIGIVTKGLRSSRVERVRPADLTRNKAALIVVAGTRDR